MSGPDGNVSNLNRNVFTALQAVKDPKAMTAADAKSLQQAIFKDGHIDDAESDLLQELTQDKNHAVKVGAQKSADFNPMDLNLVATSGDAKQTLLFLRTHPEELNRLWNGGTEGMKDMTKLYTSSPKGKEVILDFVAEQFKAAWDKSEVINGYAPLREVIAQSFKAVNSSDPETAKNGRMMLYDGSKALDNYVNDIIPDFIYSWLKPSN